eukprot:695533-Ditylum_brightwellii.AAC.2
MDQASQDNGTQPNTEYEDQFIWDNNTQESIAPSDKDEVMDTPEESSSKKSKQNSGKTNQPNKHRVELNT